MRGNNAQWTNIKSLSAVGYYNSLLTRNLLVSAVTLIHISEVPFWIIPFIINFPGNQFFHILWVILLIIAHLQSCVLAFPGDLKSSIRTTRFRSRMSIYDQAKCTWVKITQEMKRSVIIVQVCRDWIARGKIWRITSNTNHKTVWNYILQQWEF